MNYFVKSHGLGNDYIVIDEKKINGPQNVISIINNHGSKSPLQFIIRRGKQQINLSITPGVGAQC